MTSGGTSGTYSSSRRPLSVPEYVEGATKYFNVLGFRIIRYARWHISFATYDLNRIG